MMKEFNAQEFWEQYHIDMANYCKERIATKTKQLRTHCKSRKSSKHLRASIERYIEDLLRAKIAIDKTKP